jgi:MFS family permease
MLLLTVSLAALFQGFDGALASVAIRDLEATFGIQATEIGLLIPTLAIVVGSLLAWPASALADRIGRRPVLIWATVGFSVFTALTAISSSPEGFAGFQFLARICLVTELVVAVTLVAEEVPARRRGWAIGAMTAVGALGFPAAAVLHSLIGPESFKALFFLGGAGLIPALMMMRFEESVRWSHRRSGSNQLLSGPYAWEVFRIGAMFGIASIALWGTATAWPFYARSLDFSTAAIERLLGASLVAGALGHLAGGMISDRMGRRRTGTAFLILAGVFGSLLFRTETPESSLPIIMIAAFFAFGTSPIFDAIAVEAVPSRLRASTLGLARGVFVVVGAITGTFAVSTLAGDAVTEIATIGDAAGIVALTFLVAALALRGLPETSGRELEKIAAAVPEPVPDYAYGPRDRPRDTILPQGRSRSTPTPRVPETPHDWSKERKSPPDNPG